MAAFTFDISERTNVFGLAPTSVWNVYAWNAFKWGEGTAVLPLGLGLGVSEAEPSAETIDMQAIFAILIAEAGTFSGAVVDLSKMDAAGYTYVFPDRATDILDEDTPSWASATVTAANWAAVTTTSVTWS
jgi:hypothetical protein